MRSLDNQKDSPSTQEYSQNLLKDILEKTFQTNAISNTIPGPTIVQKLGKEYAQDPVFQKMYKEPIISLWGKRRNPVPRQSSLRSKRRVSYWNCYMTIIRHRTQDTSVKQKQGTESNRNTIGKGMRQTIDEYVKSCRICQKTKCTESQTIRFSTALGPSGNKVDRNHYGFHHSTP